MIAAETVFDADTFVADTFADAVRSTTLNKPAELSVATFAPLY
jgi:hypothetical protein